MIEKIKRCKKQVTGSWTYNHKTLILLLTAIVVIVVQNYGYLVPTVSLSYHSGYVSNDRPERQTIDKPCDDKCLLSEWVELRTKELMIENESSFYRSNRYQAQTELNDLILHL